MIQESINLSCPGCGAGVSTSSKTCEYCGRPVVITSFRSVAGMSMPELKKYSSAYDKTLQQNESSIIHFSAGMCALKLKLYDKACASFEKAIECDFENAEAYFYLAASLLKGKKAFLQDRDTIDKVLENLDAAISVAPSGLFYYFRAYIKYDYFHRKSYLIEPRYTDDLHEMEVSYADKQMLFEILSVEMPESLM